ncbi:MAG: hypothetical protein ACRCX2_10135 [Paraclostridium sp.]
MLIGFSNMDKIMIYNAYNKHINDNIPFEKCLRNLDFFTDKEISEILKEYGED